MTGEVTILQRRDVRQINADESKECIWGAINIELELSLMLDT
jgi:hypothetical protein